MVRVVRKTVRIEDVRQDVERLLQEEHMTYEEWQRLGQIDEPGSRLVGDRLRDAYLLYGSLLRRDDGGKGVRSDGDS